VVSDLLWILAALGALFWVVLPAGILVLALVYRGEEDLEPARIPLGPEGMWPCRAYDPTDPSVKPCWVPAGVEYCPRHDGFGEAALPSL
jgi:hypothetical protein